MSKKIVINSVNGGYMVFVDDHPLPWVCKDMDKLLAKITEEFTAEPELITKGPDWVKEELGEK